MTIKVITAALTASASVLCSSLAVAQTLQTRMPPLTRPQARQGATGDTQSQAQAAASDRQNAARELVLRGCVAREDGWIPEGRSETAPPTETRGETFVLRNGDIYHLSAGANISLSTHEGQHVEIRGRFADGDATGDHAGDHTNSPLSAAQRGSQAVQGGQMQAVGQTAQPGQGGQSGQSTTNRRTARPARTGTDAATSDPHKTMTVTSLRVISETCPASP